MDGHGIYGDETPVRLKVDTLLRGDRCPVAAGSRSQLPTANLDRWKAVAEAIVEWYRADGPDATAVAEIEGRIMGWLDPVQREVCSGLFTAYRQLLPKRADEIVDLDPASSFVYDEASHASIAVATQIGIEGPDGRELIRLKTGKRATTPEEAAVLHVGSDGPAVFFDALLAAGSLEEIESDPATREAVVAGLFAMAAPGETDRRPVREPGLHCYSCPRPARCGQYPVADGGTVGTSTRTVMVSKSALHRLPECHRRVAWQRLYSIPADDHDEEDLPRVSVTVGSAFHDAIAAALLADDPDAVMVDAARALQPSERADLEVLWAAHGALVAAEPSPVEVTRTEYGLGATVVVPGLAVDSRDRLSDDAAVAVVFQAFADAVGREPDGTAAVLEHKTGTAGTGLYLEPEVYAVGASLLLGTDRVTVHTHHLRDAAGPRCDRRVYDAAGLAAARDRLREAATVVASWHPHDALSPAYTEGVWCTWCPYEGTCSRFRGAASSG